VRAVNLIPAEERRGAGGAAGRSGGAAYVLLGLLGTLVVLASLYALTAKGLDDRRAELAGVQAQASAAQARAAGLAKYTDFADRAAKRQATVRGLAAGRFDWSQTMRELARVLPANVALTTLKGTSSATADPAAAGAAAAAGVPAATGPTAELVGCTTSQRAVAVLMSRLRSVDGVQKVDLKSSQRADAVTGAGAGGAASCPGKRPPTFTVALTFGGTR
jgi:Tfp pilus assembly protein PilN